MHGIFTLYAVTIFNKKYYLSKWALGQKGIGDRERGRDGERGRN
jgi:hypothetical protein